MPYYSYRCQNCGLELEIEQKMSEAALTKCPNCQEQSLIKIIAGNVGISFKGQGFYKNDSRKCANNCPDCKAQA